VVLRVVLGLCVWRERILLPTQVEGENPAGEGTLSLASELIRRRFVGLWDVFEARESGQNAFRKADGRAFTMSCLLGKA